MKTSFRSVLNTEANTSTVIHMEQVSEMEGKPFTSSSNVYLKAEIGWGGPGGH
jgi:hypothetical protein